MRRCRALPRLDSFCVWCGPLGWDSKNYSRLYKPAACMVNLIIWDDSIRPHSAPYRSKGLPSVIGANGRYTYVDGERILFDANGYGDAR